MTTPLDRLPGDRRRQLVQVAAAEFADAGYAGASLNRVLQQCGMSKSSFYRLVPSKAALFDLTISDLAADVLQHVDLPRPESFTEDFWGRAERAVAALADATSDRSLAALGRIFYLSDAPSDGALPDAFASIDRWLAGVLDVGRRGRSVRDDLPSDLQHRLVFAVLRTLDEWTLSRGEYFASADIPLLVEAQFAMLRRMLEPDVVRPQRSDDPDRPTVGETGGDGH